MTGDPRVLAPLQQAYLAADDGSNARTYIRYSWRAATNQHGLPWHQVDAEIRAWTPTPAEPSLEQRVAELEAKVDRHLVYLRDCIDSTEDRLAQRITSLEQHPEPTAPDDPVCQCGHEKSFHKISGTRPCMYSPDSLSPYCECESFLPAPQPAPDLDPERVEVTQENVAKALEIVGRAFHHPDTFFQYEDDRASFQFAVWVLDRIGAKFSYLKDGGA